MKANTAIVVIEKVEESRDSFDVILRTAGYHTVTFDTVEGAFTKDDPSVPGCIVLDLRSPSVMEFWRQLLARRDCHPTIAIVERGNVSLAVECMRRGALQCLESPCDHQVLLDWVDRALIVDKEIREQRLQEHRYHNLVLSLTPREREVMSMVVDGVLTKQIALKLGISPKTVEVHRSHVVKKMHCGSVAQLLQLAAKHTTFDR